MIISSFNGATKRIRTSVPTASQNRIFHNFQRNEQTERVIFSGIQPTGIPHVGNYLGAVQQWVKLQNEATPRTKLFYSVVDLHALTSPQNLPLLRRHRRETLATLLAAGLDPQRSTIFYQSSVPAHSELMWILSCNASMGYLSRMTQWKSKMQLDADTSPLDINSKVSLKLGLFSYPILQAADILVHRATHVPVGDDQTQHLEFARDCAAKFNHSYGFHLPQPETVTSPAKRVMSLQDPQLKMSKSHSDARSRILLTDSADDIFSKVKAALTDSSNYISFDPIDRPGVSNLLNLLSYFDAQERSVEDLIEVYANINLGTLKLLLAEWISNELKDIRERYLSILYEDDGRYLDSIEMDGAKRANESANATMEVVRNAIGL